MERAIRDNEFVVIICTPRYKRRSDAREGGVGYEGDIMTAEVPSSQNHRKFIPVLRSGPWPKAAPSWLLGKYYINLTGDPYSARDYEDLVRTLLGIRETVPPLGEPMATITPHAIKESKPIEASAGSEFEDIKIMRVIVEDITEPRNDGTYGSALYSIPFALSRTPPAGWTHGTTIEEVERYHRDTLQLAVAETNRQYRDSGREQEQRQAREQAICEEHRKRIDDASKRIKFD